MLRRRRSVPEGFARLADAVESAKEALLAAVPRPRQKPQPLASSLIAFEEALGRAREALDAWRDEGSQDVAERCRDALEETARRAEWLRLEAPRMDFESLVLVLGDVIAPLDAFVEVEHELRRR